MKHFGIFFVALFAFSVSSIAQKNFYKIPLLNNTYIYNNSNKQNATVDNNGLFFGSSQSESFARSYFYLKQSQVAQLFMEIKGTGTIEVSLENIKGKKKTKCISVKGKEFQEILIGKFKTKTDGYIRVTYKPKKIEEGITIKYLKLKSNDKPIFLAEDFNTHFGLRGPSCHLAYNTGEHKDIEWALIDVMVPEQFDQNGSYYMALGFSGGYFGMQNNSKTKRQVLFSVWNSVDEDNPENVSFEHRTQVVRCGKNVVARNFGHEGSGKQTFISIDWKPNVPYRFLLNAKKIDSLSTEYSAWFYNTPKKEWIFMATLRRPNTLNLLSGLHSFIENFNPAQGDKMRKAYYFNVWYKPTNESWTSVTEAKLTNDLTGRDGVRLDFNGGVENEKFFLMNGGYFDRAFVLKRNLSCNISHLETPKINLSQILKITN